MIASVVRKLGDFLADQQHIDRLNRLAIAAIEQRVRRGDAIANGRTLDLALAHRDERIDGQFAPFPALALRDRILTRGGRSSRPASSRLVPSLSFVEPRERGYAQANWVTLTDACRRNDSLGDDFEHKFRLAGVAKLFEGSLVSFTHRGNRLRFEPSILLE